MTGALLAVAHRRRLDTCLIGLVIVVNFVVGLAVPRINVIGHVGGLLTRLLVGAGLEWARSTRGRVQRQAAVVAGCALALAAGAAAGVPADRAVAIGYLGGAPRVLPRYLAVDRTATYKVYVYQDPAGPRTVVMAFGDGTTTRKTVEVSVVTDICPDGTREGTPAEEADEALAREAPECLRQS